MVRIIVSTLIILLTTYFPFLPNSSLIGAPQQEEKTNPPAEAKHKNIDYTIVIPHGWEIVKDDLGVDLVALAPKTTPPTLFRENLNVISVTLDTPMTREQFYDYNMRSLEQMLESYDLEDSKDITIDGVPARKIVFTHTTGIVNVRVVQYLTLIGSKAYVMTFSAARLDYDKIAPQFDQIANSFKFKK